MLPVALSHREVSQGQGGGGKCAGCHVSTTVVELVFPCSQCVGVHIHTVGGCTKGHGSLFLTGRGLRELPGFGQLLENDSVALVIPAGSWGPFFARPQLALRHGLSAKQGPGTRTGADDELLGTGVVVGAEHVTKAGPLWSQASDTMVCGLSQACPCPQPLEVLLCSGHCQFKNWALPMPTAAAGAIKMLL